MGRLQRYSNNHAGDGLKALYVVGMGLLSWVLYSVFQEQPPTPPPPPPSPPNTNYYIILFTGSGWDAVNHNLDTVSEKVNYAVNTPNNEFGLYFEQLPATIGIPIVFDDIPDTPPILDGGRGYMTAMVNKSEEIARQYPGAMAHIWFTACCGYGGAFTIKILGGSSDSYGITEQSTDNFTQNNGANQYIVIAHEFGHLLGLQHSQSGLMRIMPDGNILYDQSSRNELLSILDSLRLCNCGNLKVKGW